MSAPARAPRAFYVLVPLLAVLLSLAAAELGLRLLWPTPRASEYNLAFEPDPWTGYRMRASASGWFVRGVEGRTNAHGQRDDETPLAKPAGRHRILLLGDSFSVGVNVAQPDIYPQLLERALRERCGPAVEVVNTAVAGWDPFQYARYYEHTGERFEPDQVVVGFFVGNDAYSTSLEPGRQLTAVMGRRVHPPASTREARLLAARIWLYGHSHLARRWWNRELRVLAPEDFAREPEPRDGGRFTSGYLGLQASRMGNHRKRNALQTELATRNVDEIARIHARTRAAGIPLLVVLIPDENQVNAGLRDAIFADPRLIEQIFPRRADVPRDPRAPFDLAMPQRLLAELFAARGIATLDLLPDFLAAEARLYMNDSHWNEAGHRLVAARLLEPLAAGVPGCARTAPRGPEASAGPRA